VTVPASTKNSNAQKDELAAFKSQKMVRTPTGVVAPNTAPTLEESKSSTSPLKSMHSLSKSLSEIDVAEPAVASKAAASIPAAPVLPKPVSFDLAQLTASASNGRPWSALANVRNMEQQAQQLARSQQLLQKRDSAIAAQLDRMDSDLSVMVAAFDGSNVAASSDYQSQYAQLRGM
jgi:hypothetical protein